MYDLNMGKDVKASPVSFISGSGKKYLELTRAVDPVILMVNGMCFLCSQAFVPVGNFVLLVLADSIWLV